MTDDKLLNISAEKAAEWFEGRTLGATMPGARGMFQLAAAALWEKAARENPQTNADRIRAMRDEELANLLINIANDDGYDLFCDNPKRMVACMECKRCIMEWVKQPADMGGNS